MNKVKLSINQIELEVENGTTILQACESVGVVVPRFCYHEKLSVAGNCRMCLVEVGSKTPDGKLSMMPKLQASCAIPVTNGMVVVTESVSVKKAREGIMELLLVNHPLDCPICDQGGECDLQDQSMTYGSDHGRLLASKPHRVGDSKKVLSKQGVAKRVVESSLLVADSKKRAVKDKNLGPLIKTIMTRCIHCTRCVRFASEIAGCGEIGTIGRGNNLEIARSAFDTSKRDKQAISLVDAKAADIKSSLAGALLTEVSGNLIDVCPVGALTSAPYAFTARPWELRSIESVDMSDSYGSKIRADVRGSIMRILPSKAGVSLLSGGSSEQAVLCRLSPSGWISDKTRFSYDGLKRQRLNQPMVAQRGTTDNGVSFNKVSWEEAINEAAALLTKDSVSNKGKKVAVIGSGADVEGLTALKQQLSGLFSEVILTEVATRHPTVSVEQNSVGADSLSSSVSKWNTAKQELTASVTSVSASVVECIPSLVWYKSECHSDQSLKSVSSSPDCVLLVGCNPRTEATGLNLDLKELLTRNSRLRSVRPNGKPPFKIASIGAPLQLSYPVKHLGTNLACITAIIDGKHPFSKELAKAEHPLIILGSSVLNKSISGSSLYNRVLAWCNQKLARSVLVLQNTPSAASALAVGYDTSANNDQLGTTQKQTASSTTPSVLLLWNVHPDSVAKLKSTVLTGDSVTASTGVLALCRKAKANGTSIIYVGSHGNELAAIADVILPATAFTEREGSIVNTLGLVQRTRVVTSAPGQAREEWSIFYALSDAITAKRASSARGTAGTYLNTFTPTAPSARRSAVSGYNTAEILATYIPQALTQWSVLPTTDLKAATLTQKVGVSALSLCKISKLIKDVKLTVGSASAFTPQKNEARCKLAVYSSLTGNTSSVAVASSSLAGLSQPLHTTIDNYYTTDQVSANSVVLTKASKGLLIRECAYSAAADRYIPTIFTVTS
jgi:NADH dehydrogenase/NADH:ubiquinone oxidoreductase subunit G